MPSNYGAHPNRQARFYARQNRRQTIAKRTSPVMSRPPYLGWCPDLPAYSTLFNGYRDGRGVVGMPWRGGLGYYLRPDLGWTRIGSAQLPLASSRACVGLAPIRLDNGDYEGYAVHAGVTSTTNITMSRFKADATWATVAKHASANSVQTDRDVLFDGVTFALGSPTRSSAINQAILVWGGIDENGNPVEVLCTPDATGVGSYDELDRFSSLDPFKAGSVEVFESKVLFFNTSEGGTAYPYRLRYSGEGTADPDPTETGSGYYEFTEFTQPGLRVKYIGAKIACYFGDGVAFLRPTGIPGDAFTPDYTTRSRGLLGKFCITPVAEDVHFGIFTDGFWLLNSVGQWKRVGVTVADGQTYDKFWHTFINSVAVDQRHKIVVTYDAPRRMVRIAYPTLTNTENNQILNIVLNESEDVGWQDYYADPVTMWGRWNAQIRTATTWAMLTTAGTTWAQLMAAGTLWSDFAAAYGVQSVIQGNATGLVFQRDGTIYTQDGVTPPWYLEFHPINVSKGIAQDQTLRSVVACFRDISGPSIAVQVSGNQGGHIQQVEMELDEDSTEALAEETFKATFHHRASAHKIRLSGSAPFLIGRWGAFFETDEALDMRGQNT